MSGALRRKAPVLACAAHLVCTAGRSLWPQVTSTLQSAEYVHGEWLYRRATFSTNLKMPSTRRKSVTLSVVNKPQHEAAGASGGCWRIAWTRDHAHAGPPAPALGLAAREKDRLRNVLVRVEQHLRLDRESGIAQPGCHLARLAAVDVDLHRVAAVALRLQPRFVADVKAEQQRSTGTQRPPEVPENRGDRVVGDVNQRPKSEQASDRGDR